MAAFDDGANDFARQLVQQRAREVCGPLVMILYLFAAVRSDGRL
jgi:hypothetical protein